jgi:hypothetical protein
VITKKTISLFSAFFLMLSAFSISYAAHDYEDLCSEAYGNKQGEIFVLEPIMNEKAFAVLKFACSPNKAVSLKLSKYGDTTVAYITVNKLRMSSVYLFPTLNSGAFFKTDSLKGQALQSALENNSRSFVTDPNDLI